MNQQIQKAEAQSQHGSHARHGWMMIVCCFPVLIIAGALVATGVVSASFLFAAIACFAMMVAMMVMTMRRTSAGGQNNR
jgi:hypothetical protein